MRILVVTSDVPFVQGGHRVIARSLVTALRAAGHEAECLTTPQNRFGRQVSAYLATRWTDVEMAGDGSPVDQIISLRFPSYAVQHPRHTVWLNHRMREYYDLWDGYRATLGPCSRVVEGLRRWVLHSLDRRFLSKAGRVFAQSRTIQERLRRWGNIESDVLYPPPPQRDYRCDDRDGSILSVGRLTPLKRIELLLEAASVDPNIRLRIAGEGPDEARLRGRAEALGIVPRVAFLGRLTEDELVDEYARCSGVYFGARAEDYGLVTLEAFSSAKPVVTCVDSGGPAELVQDGQTGFVTLPTPQALAPLLARICSVSDCSEELGRNAHDVASAHSWDQAVAALLDR